MEGFENEKKLELGLKYKVLNRKDVERLIEYNIIGKGILFLLVFHFVGCSNNQIDIRMVNKTKI